MRVTPADTPEAAVSFPHATMALWQPPGIREWNMSTLSLGPATCTLTLLVSSAAVATTPGWSTLLVPVGSAIAVVVSLVSAVAACLTWRAMTRQFRAGDCPALVLQTLPEDDNCQSIFRGSIFLQTVTALATVKNVGSVAAVWWGWQLDVARGVGEPATVSFGLGQSLSARGSVEVPALGNLAKSVATLRLYSQGPSGTEWVSTIRVENGKQMSLHLRQHKKSKAKLLNAAGKRQAEYKKRAAGLKNV